MLALLLTFAISHSLSAATKAEAVIDCEFLLTEAADAGASVKWLHDSLTLAQGEDDAFLGYAPRGKAFQALGLPSPYPAHTRMKVEPPSGPEESFVLRIISASGKELARFPFEIPPVGVWKQVKDWGDNGEVELDRQITREDPERISVGVLLGDFPAGRKFIVVRRRMANMVTVAVGLDVALDQHSNFSRSPDMRVVSTDTQTILSRIEVVKAHFRVPTSYHRRQERVH